MGKVPAPLVTALFPTRCQPPQTPLALATAHLPAQTALPAVSTSDPASTSGSQPASHFVPLETSPELTEHKPCSILGTLVCLFLFPPNPPLHPVRGALFSRPHSAIQGQPKLGEEKSKSVKPGKAGQGEKRTSGSPGQPLAQHRNPVCGNLAAAAAPASA